MEVLKPVYYGDFKCIANKCIDSKLNIIKFKEER